ncbi:MAG: hypothetical protein KIS96_15815 [Bauldia sp.]|nr:hypothetical protein [Bauldia sp.]
MKTLEYLVFRDETSRWLVTADGIDCGIAAELEVAALSAIRWAHRRHLAGRRVRVTLRRPAGPPRTLWRSGQPYPPLRLLGGLMRRPSAWFVRDWTEWTAGCPG